MNEDIKKVVVKNMQIITMRGAGDYLLIDNCVYFAKVTSSNDNDIDIEFTYWRDTISVTTLRRMLERSSIINVSKQGITLSKFKGLRVASLEIANWPRISTSIVFGTKSEQPVELKCRHAVKSDSDSATTTE